MSYCAVTDIQSEFKSVTFSSTSSPTDTTVSGFITQADNMINGIVGRKYVTPVTGTVSSAILKAIEIALVKRRVEDILGVKSPAQSVNQGNAQPKAPKTPEDMLNDIVSGKLLLPDATLAVSNDGVDSYVYANSYSPTFNVGTDQW